MEDRAVSDVIYLYGFVPAGTPEPPAALAGMADTPVQCVALDGVTAVVSRVPAERFSPERLAMQLADVAWVGEQGLAHERVVLWFVDRGDIVPARMFSLYGSDAAMRTAVAAQLDTIHAQLTRLGGRREWDLKIAYDASELARHAHEVSADIAKLDEEIAQAAPGRRYLLERKRADMLKADVTRWARELAAALTDALAGHAEETRRLPLAANDDQGNVVMHAALLVRTDAEAALRAEAERQAERATSLGMIVSFSGPWAPYRFIEESA